MEVTLSSSVPWATLTFGISKLPTGSCFHCCPGALSELPFSSATVFYRSFYRSVVGWRAKSSCAKEVRGFGVESEKLASESAEGEKRFERHCGRCRVLLKL